MDDMVGPTTTLAAMGGLLALPKEQAAAAALGHLIPDLLSDRPQWLTVAGISYFWFLGALFQMDLLLFGSETLKVSDQLVGLMVTCLAVGIGVGSMLAGKLSGDKVELGLVPLGSILMGLLVGATVKGCLR